MPRILKVESLREAVVEAVRVLEEGGLVVYPTETCYGLAADILNLEAVRRVYEVKRRPLSRPLTVIVSDVGMWSEYAQLDCKALKLIRSFNPGPLTVATFKKPKTPDMVNPNGLAARIPGCSIARRIVEDLGRPVTATSANLHGAPNPYAVDEVVRQVGGEVDLILDRGRLPEKPVSTIVDLRFDPPRIERAYPKGSYRVWEILDVLREA